ncbi:unnamed protein product [Mytilus coruscus]|uniref:Uncharacterized protein n=1 Tax=Mytilus coruscus TaxID=42192 RepID=A0A6J8E5Q3_MYTCO|nr:unnamed protein product [Mytilus coruscus]
MGKGQQIHHMILHALGCRKKMQEYSYSLQGESDSEPEQEHIKVVASKGVKRRIVFQDNDNSEAASKRSKSEKIPSDIAASIRYIDEMRNLSTIDCEFVFPFIVAYVNTTARVSRFDNNCHNTVPDEIEVSGNVDDNQVRTSEPDSNSVEDAHDADDELQIQDQNEENDASSFVQEAPVEESETEDEEDETSDNVVRLSTRMKTSTATTKYKDFVAKSAQKTDWMIRAEYLKSAASSGIFSKYGDDVSKAMLKLISQMIEDIKCIVVLF